MEKTAPINQPIRILQLTDLHLFKNQNVELLDFNPYHSLKQVMVSVDQLMQEQAIDLIALTGDVSQDYSQESYQIAKQIFAAVPCPLIATMGNHDNLATFTEYFNNIDDGINKIVALGDWVALLINSHWPNHISGQLSKNELAFLEDALRTAANKHIIIFIHHHVLSVNSTWIDKIGVSNAQDFLNIIDKHQNIRAVICGHVHQETYFERNQVKYFSTPATSWQFATNSPNFKLDTLMPGFRLLELYKDGTFATKVIRIPHNQIFIPDLSSAGY